MTGPVPGTHATAGPGGRRLRIAVSCNVLHADVERVFYPHSALPYVEEQMAGWVSATGALAYPVPTPTAQTGVALADYVADLDGLVLTGGADVSPRSYGEEPEQPEWSGDEVRDRYEIDLLRRFVDAGKPVLGICRGEQVMNVAFGGTLHQDLLTDGVAEHAHRSQEAYHHLHHDVDLVEGSWVASLHPGVTRARINSIHHQAVRRPGAQVVVEARSADDGVVEAIRVDDGDVWARAVQWHPEFHALCPDDGLLDTGPLLGAFLDEAARRAH